jgi:hypothetical protein
MRSARKPDRAASTAVVITLTLALLGWARPVPAARADDWTFCDPGTAADKIEAACAHRKGRARPAPAIDGICRNVTAQGRVGVTRAGEQTRIDMARSVADQFVETLAAASVKRIYGIVGDSLNGITDSLRRQGKIEWIHVRHEEVAAFAAGAEAHLTGELAVCAGSCGPGNLHLINGLFDCHRSRVPVVAIAAQVPSAEIGAGYFQETHPETLFKECSHYCELIFRG